MPILYRDLQGVPLFRNLRFEKIRVQDAPVLVEATEIYPKKMLDGLVLDDISGTCEKGISIANARHVALKHISITGYTGPLLRLANVTGSGLEGAAKMAASQITDLVEAPSVPYKLH